VEKESSRKRGARRRGKYKRLRHYSIHVLRALRSAKAKGLVYESARKFRVFAANEELVSQGSH